MVVGDSTFSVGTGDDATSMTMQTGDVLRVPAGIPHGFTNSGTQVLRQVDIHAYRAHRWCQTRWPNGGCRAVDVSSSQLEAAAHFSYRTTYYDHLRMSLMQIRTILAELPKGLVLRSSSRGVGFDIIKGRICSHWVVCSLVNQVTCFRVVAAQSLQSSAPESPRRRVLASP